MSIDANSRDHTLQLSVVIPARNEAGELQKILTSTAEILTQNAIPFELLVVDDYSTDDTGGEARKASPGSGTIRCVQNRRNPGIGNAIETGIRRARGGVIAIMMGDGSDSPDDLIRYYSIIEQGSACAFGSRFTEGANVEGYPPVKLVLNRLGNWLIALAFACRYSDFTNAFKAYRASLLTGMLPLRSQGFEVTLELPIRALLADATFRVVPISWRGRSSGESKMKTLAEVWRYLYRLARLRLRNL